MFVVTEHVFCRDKSMLVATILLLLLCLSQQNFCRDRHHFVATKDMVCRDIHTCLSRQTCVYLDQTSVATKMILVAAPANVTFLVLPRGVRDTSGAKMKVHSVENLVYRGCRNEGPLC